MRALSFCSNRYGWSGESERGWLVVGDEGFDVIWLSFVFALLFAVCCLLLPVAGEDRGVRDARGHRWPSTATKPAGLVCV